MSEKLRTMLLLVAAWELVPISTGLAALSLPFLQSERFLPRTMLQARLSENIPILVGAFLIGLVTGLLVRRNPALWGAAVPGARQLVTSTKGIIHTWHYLAQPSNSLTKPEVWIPYGAYTLSLASACVGGYLGGLLAGHLLRLYRRRLAADRTEEGRQYRLRFPGWPWVGFVLALSGLAGAGTLVAVLPQVHMQFADLAWGDFLRQYGPPESFVVLRLCLQSVLMVIIALLFLFLTLVRVRSEGRLAVKLDEAGVEVFDSRGKGRHLGWRELHSVRGPTWFEVLLDGGLVLGTAEGEIPLDVHVERQDELLLALQGRLAEQTR